MSGTANTKPLTIAAEKEKWQALRQKVRELRLEQDRQWREQQAERERKHKEWLASLTPEQHAAWLRKQWERVEREMAENAIPLDAKMMMEMDGIHLD